MWHRQNGYFSNKQLFFKENFDRDCHGHCLLLGTELSYRQLTRHGLNHACQLVVGEGAFIQKANLPSKSWSRNRNRLLAIFGTVEPGMRKPGNSYHYNVHVLSTDTLEPTLQVGPKPSICFDTQMNAPNMTSGPTSVQASLGAWRCNQKENH